MTDVELLHLIFISKMKCDIKVKYDILEEGGTGLTA